MTGLEISFLVVVLSILFFSGVICLISSEGGESEGMVVIGFVALVITIGVCSFYSYRNGMTHVAINATPTALDEGVLYEKVHSQSRTKSTVKGDAKCFRVWLQWNGSDRACLYRLDQDPPDKFIYQDGKFIAVE